MKQIRAVVIALAIIWPPLALAADSAHVTIRGGWAGLGVGANWGDGANAERAAGQMLSLPLHPDLTDAEVDRVIDVVAGFLR